MDDSTSGSDNSIIVERLFEGLKPRSAAGGLMLLVIGTAAAAIATGALVGADGFGEPESLAAACQMVAVGALFAVGATAIWAALSSYSDGRDSWEPDSVVLRIFCWVLMVPAVLLGMAGIFMGVAGIGFGLFFVASLLLGRI